MSRIFDKRWMGEFLYVVVLLIVVVGAGGQMAFPYVSAVAPVLSSVIAMAVAGLLIATTVVMFMQWVVVVQNLHDRWVYGHTMSTIELLRARADRAGYLAIMLLTGLASAGVIRYVVYSPVDTPPFVTLVIVVLVAAVACISLARARMHDTDYRRELAKNVLY